MSTAKEYTDKMYNVLMGNRQNLMSIYEGKNGALRLAREYGYGLNDFTEKERKDIIGSTYGALCVRFYNLKPPIDAKQWVTEIIKSIK
jgi:hypothetical protein